MTRSQDFIQKHSTRLSEASAFYNFDTALMRRERYDTAKFRFLLVLPSPAEDKAVSTTAAVINDFFIQYLPDCYIDVAWLPNPRDIKIYDQNRIPYAIGCMTHLDASYFDVVGFSFSILHEMLTVPVMISSFNRCDTPIPLTWSERKDLSLSDVPIIIGGGISSPQCEVCFGDIGDGRTSFLDGLLLGTIEPIKEFINIYLQSKQDGTTVQQFLDRCFSLSNFYQPQAYEVKYEDNRIISNIKINPLAQDQVRPYFAKSFERRLYTARGITSGNGENAGLLSWLHSEGCAGKANCNFCAEGWYSGSWTENPVENIIWAAKEGRKWSAARKCKAMSFNHNYHSKFKENLYELRKIFKQVSFNNMRLNEIGHDIDQWKMMSQLGQLRFFAPIEGISDRIRNGILNKGLDKEVVDTIFEDLVGDALSEVKVGVIYTGYETDEDWEELYEVFNRVFTKAAKYNKKYHLRMKFSNLIHYTGTPCWYSERVVARTSYNKGRNISTERYLKNREHNLRILFTGFLGSTFIEQALIDLGRSLTPWLYRNFVVKNHVVYALGSVARSNAFDELRSLITHENFWAERSPDACISPMHRIRLELQGSLISSARALLRNIHSHDHREMVRCLYTYDGCKVLCGSNDMVDAPYKEYGDVLLINGALDGYVINELTGCDICKSSEEKLRNHLQRKIYNDTYSVDDLRAQQLSSNFAKYRFVLTRNGGGFRELNPSNTAYMSLAAMLRSNDKLNELYWEITDYTNSLQTFPFMPFNVSGRQLVDVTFKDEVYDDLLNTLPKANELLQTCRINNIYKVDLSDTIRSVDFMLYRFETTLSYTNMLMDCNIYKGMIEVASDDGLYDKIEDPSLLPPLIHPKGGKTVGYFTLPTKYNPLLYLATLVRHKTVTKPESRTIFNIQAIDCLRESYLTCNCGNYALVSLTNNKTYSCKTCILKQLLSKELK